MTSRADLLLRGIVRTGDPAAPLARAVAVRGGVVVALDQDALELAGGSAAVVDLEGGAVMAGFGDGHAHPMWGGVELAGPDVRDATTVEEVAARVRRFADEHPELDWVVGGPYAATLTHDALFDARWLDAAVPDRPVLLEASDHHCAWVNTAALRRAGLDEHTPDPPAGSLPKRPDGSLLGTLVEWTAVDLVRSHAPTVTAQDKREGLARSTRLLAAAGITWVQDAAVQVEDAAVYPAVAEGGDLPVRLNLALRAEPGQWPRQRREFLEARALVESGPAAGQVSARTVKFFADGIVEVRSAAMIDPYTDAPHTCGLPVWDPRELAEAVAAVDADGFQVHIHAIGDAGVRAALDAVAHASAVNGPRDRRPVLAHVQLVDRADLPRFAQLGVIANFEPLWAQLDAAQTEQTLPLIGDERGRLQYPMGDLLTRGGVLSMGSDWPVSSYRPLEGLAVAVTRQTEDGEPAGGWLPEQRLPAAAALSAYTLGTAYQAFEDHLWGTVSPGKRADLVWLSRDPYAVPAPEWPAIEVRGTWLGGVRTF
ncbi:MAG: hypothetical protein QOE01_934 [Actinomycetota bacterium]|nr:hypothetical protein [Actinomycetota bacterium]